MFQVCSCSKRDKFEVNFSPFIELIWNTRTHLKVTLFACRLLHNMLTTKII